MFPAGFQAKMIKEVSEGDEQEQILNQEINAEWKKSKEKKEITFKGCLYKLKSQKKIVFMIPY